MSNKPFCQCLVLSVLLLVSAESFGSWWWPFGGKKKTVVTDPAQFYPDGEIPAAIAPRTKEYVPTRQEDGVSVKHLQELAKAGNANAMLTLGKIFFEGRAGQKKDYVKAHSYFLQAAQQDNPQGMFNVAICYDAGYGVTRNMDEAIRWYYKAADYGVPEAQANASNAAEQRGDYASALKYLRMLADSGNSAAMVKAASYLQSGLGGPINDELAAQYLLNAASKGNRRAQVRLADCYQTGRGVTRNYEEMFSWLTLAAQDGDAEAQAKLGYCYQNGIGTIHNASQAFNWYEAASESGYAPALVSLGDCYRDGYGTAMDRQTAFSCYRQAAEQGEAIGEFSLAVAYHDGIGTPKDMQQARHWMELAANHGLVMAQVEMGLFLSGKYPEIPADREASKTWFEMAAAQHDPAGMFQLAVCYLADEKATAEERTKANDLLKQAADKGYEPAIRLQARLAEVAQ